MSGERILVVDDDDFTRTLVGALVASLGYSLCGKAGSAATAMSLVQTPPPDAAVLDLDLGEGPTGIDLAHGLRRILPNIAIVMLTSYSDPVWMGVNREPPVGSRYVVKGSIDDPAVLEHAIIDALASPLASASTSRPTLQLSESQVEILRLIAAGLTNAEIARRRSLTEDAVNKAVSRLVRRLDLHPGPSENPRVLLAQAYNRLIGTVSDRRA